MKFYLGQIITEGACCETVIISMVAVVEKGFWDKQQTLVLNCRK